MTVRHLALVPRDGFFCKDGRDWHTSASGRGHGLDWPWPSTVLGALRTAWGRGQELRLGTVFSPQDWRERTKPVHLGRMLAVRRPHGRPQVGGWKPEDTVWPVPTDAMWIRDQADVHRLDPRFSYWTLGRDDDAAREGLLWPKVDDLAKPLPRPSWWGRVPFSAWLAGEAVAAGDNGHTLRRRIQARVGIDASTLTVMESMLFSHDIVETLERDVEWAIGAEAFLPEGEDLTVATLGSDARLSRVETLPEALFAPPQPVLDAFRGGSPGLRLITVTPACFAAGWLPDGFAMRDGCYRGHLPGLAGEVALRAAFVGRPVHISGWDMERGAPKPTARMAAPGAVYFFERTDGGTFGEADARSLWLAALGTRTEEGFGRVVPGVWSPKGGTP